MNRITQFRLACKSNAIIKVNPDMQHLREYVETIPQSFDVDGQTVRHVRNHIKIFEVGGKRINVKKYAIPPYFFNRIVYVLFRDPKAKRHYDYALKLQALGFDSPTPIGYHLQKNGLLLSHCYLLTEQVDNMCQLADLKELDIATDVEYILSEFGRYTAALHKNGILHGDYTSGNILFQIKDNWIKFALVDINRMSFHEVSFNGGCGNFCRLNLEPQQLKIVAEAYAQAMNYDKEETYNKIISYRNKRKSWFKWKLCLKSVVSSKRHN